MDELRAGLRRNPEIYSYWLKIAVENDYWLKRAAMIEALVAGLE